MKLMELLNRILRCKGGGELDTTKLPNQDKVEQALAQKIIEDARRHRAATLAEGETGEEID